MVSIFFSPYIHRVGEKEINNLTRLKNVIAMLHRYHMPKRQNILKLYALA